MAGLAPDVYWLDSSELAAAAWQLGVAHPPGHGLAALLGPAVEPDRLADDLAAQDEILPAPPSRGAASTYPSPRDP